MRKFLITLSGGLLLLTPTTALTNTLIVNQNNHQLLAAKTDLNTITTLTGQPITADTKQTYQALIKDVNQFDQFKQKPLTTGYQIQFLNQSQDDITTQQQALENITDISVKITSAASDQNYTGSTIINLTNQLIIIDDEMQSYFSKTVLPLASTEPPIAIKTTSDRNQGVNEIINTMLTQLKQYKSIILIVLKGLYKVKINFDKFASEQNVFDNNQNPVPNDWFSLPSTNKTALVKIYYGKTKTTSDGFFFPIKVNLN